MNVLSSRSLFPPSTSYLISRSLHTSLRHLAPPQDASNPSSSTLGPRPSSSETPWTNVDLPPPSSSSPKPPSTPPRQPLPSITLSPSPAPKSTAPPLRVPRFQDIILTTPFPTPDSKRIDPRARKFVEEMTDRAKTMDEQAVWDHVSVLTQHPEPHTYEGEDVRGGQMGWGRVWKAGIAVGLGATFFTWLGAWETNWESAFATYKHQQAFFAQSPSLAPSTPSADLTNVASSSSSPAVPSEPASPTVFANLYSYGGTLAFLFIICSIPIITSTSPARLALSNSLPASKAPFRSLDTYISRRPKLVNLRYSMLQVPWKFKNGAAFGGAFIHPGPVQLTRNFVLLALFGYGAWESFRRSDERLMKGEMPKQATTVYHFLSFVLAAAGASSLVIAAQTSLVALPQLSRSLLAMFRSRTALLDPAYLNMIRISAAPPSTKLLLPVGHPLAVKAGMVYHSGMAQVVGACVGVAVLDGMAMLFGLEAEKGGEKERGVKPEDVVRGTLGGLGVGWVLREIANVRMKATPAYVGLAGLPGLAVGMVYYFLSDPVWSWARKSANYWAGPIAPPLVIPVVSTSPAPSSPSTTDPAFAHNV